MRKFLLQAFVALCVFGIPSLASAAPNPSPADTAKVAAILAQYPAGGQGLVDAVTRAIEADPTLVDALVTAAVNAAPAQQQAIGTGLAQASIYFANACGQPRQTARGRSSNLCAAARAAQQEIQAAMAFAPAGLLTAFDLGGGFRALIAFLTAIETRLIEQHCVSPSRPGFGC